jgi:hypothetical protein
VRVLKKLIKKIIIKDFRGNIIFGKGQ